MNIFTEEEYSKYENIWIKENKNGKYGASKELSDEEYINYHIWEDINSELMYKTYIPEARVIRGKNPNIIFHGGCLGCISQRNHGIDRCKNCMYFRAKWDNTNLFIPGEDSAKMNGEDFQSLFQ